MRVDRDVVDVHADVLGTQGLVDAAAVDAQPVEPEPGEQEVPGRLASRRPPASSTERVVARGAPGSGRRARDGARGTRPAARSGRCPSAARDVREPVVVAELDHGVGPVAPRRRARSRCRGCGTAAARSARSSRSVRTAPPSPVVMILAGCRRSTVRSASVPTVPAVARRAQRVRGVRDERQPARRAPHRRSSRSAS